MIRPAVNVEMSININKGIHLMCFFGMGLSYYAYVVETTKEHDANYVAMCDISEHMSCSKVFMSSYGRGFGIIQHILGLDSILNQPNSLGGMIFYCILIGLNYVSTLRATKVMLCLAAVSNILSIYLAYILYFILYDLCVVCVATYVVNFINLVLITIKFQRLSRHKDCGSQSHIKSASKKKA